MQEMINHMENFHRPPVAASSSRTRELVLMEAIYRYMYSDQDKYVFLDPRNLHPEVMEGTMYRFFQQNTQDRRDVYSNEEKMIIPHI